MIKKYCIYFFCILLLLATGFVFSLQDGFSAMRSSSKGTKYRAVFGDCPSRSAGTLTLKLVKVFEQSQSLRDVKLAMIDEKLSEKHFVSDYKIQYDPFKKFLKFNLNCPKPLMKVQVYKDDGQESYEAILVENGELYDPTYEVLLKNEKKIEKDLPFLALPVSSMDNDIQYHLAKLVKNVAPALRKKFSEVIINENGELTVILSVKGYPSSVFMGDNEWDTKLDKLKKIVAYMEEKGKIPAIVNLVNSKKVVVKFNDKF